MNRYLTRTWQSVIDLTVLSAAFWLAWLLRFDWDLPLQMFKRLVFTWPYVVAFQFLVIVALGVTRFSWRYVGLREANRIALAVGLSTGVLLLVRFSSEALVAVIGYAIYALVPAGVLTIDAVLAFVFLAGVRVARRLSHERAMRAGRMRPASAPDRVLLIGAGAAGVVVAKELASRPDLNLLPIGFLDDDPSKQGAVMHGLPVLGPIEDLAKLRHLHEATLALITIANAPGHKIRRIAKVCEEAGVPTKIIPGIYEIVGGRVNLNRIRPVAIEDLLGREPVHLDEEAIHGVIEGRTILVTGAGGSIGSELCRQICRFRPRALLLVERAENNLFQIHLELRASFPDLKLLPCLASVDDVPRMAAIFAAHSPQVVFHAAAHKHVPMMEWNPGEAIKNNLVGTRRLTDLALASKVEAFVMISTDKAVNPTSVMGATKRAAELYVQALGSRGDTRFSTVRFGNVLGSSGSVVPIFKEQIRRGGPVTVTHPEMKRYFMTTPEACQLVLQAASMGRGGEVFVLDMGEPVKIVDLARDLIELSGLRADEDIEIVFSGVRPGEKLFEEMNLPEEEADRTRHPKIYVGSHAAARDFDELAAALDAIADDVEHQDAETLRARLAAVVGLTDGGSAA